MTVTPQTAADVLAGNWVDARGYTLPTSDGLYPHQWNWDSAFSALGWAVIDPARAYEELETLCGGQHPDGLIPHIAFSPARQDYFPSADWWPPRFGVDGRRVSSISQPPVAATCLRLLFARVPDEARARALLEPLDRWHAWWLHARDPLASGEPVLIHPWESGRDNSPDWDHALDGVPRLEVGGQRRDLRWVGLDERPSHVEYERYAWIVRSIRTGDALEQRQLAITGTFRVADPGVSCILAAACADLAALAAELGEPEIAERAAERAARLEERLTARADSEGIAPTLDVRAQAEEVTPGAGWALNLLRSALPARALDRLEEACCRGELASELGVRSWSPTAPRFDPRAYWRGPVWANITWLCALGLERHGRPESAALLRERLRAAWQAAGAREYVHGDTGEGLGAGTFSWTAALCLWEGLAD